MGTNSIKEKDMLHGGKPSSYGRKARRKNLLKEMKPSQHNGKLTKMMLVTNA